MIAAQCLEIREKIEEMRRVRTISKEIQGFTERENKLAELVARVKSLTLTKQVFEQEIIGQISTPQVVGQIYEKINKIRDSFIADPCSILEPNSLKQLESNIKSFCTEMENNLITQWNAYKARTLINLNPELLTVLEKIPDFRKKVQKVMENVKDIQKYHAAYPTNKQEVEKFHSRAAELIVDWNKLDSSNIPPTVLNFLKSAVSGGAPVTTLTVDVLKWLQDHKVENSFRIKLTS